MTHPIPTASLQQPSRSWLILVWVVAVAASAGVYLAFLQDPAGRWGSLDHDRNSHALTALQLALDLRSWDVWSLALDLERIRTWPPLHAVLVGGFSAVAGTDYRLAVLPNLAAWAVGAVFAFRLAFSLSPRHGEIAGLVAMGFWLSSPSHRVFATDFMLESLGATLTLCTLTYYVRLKQVGGTAAWLAASLSLLFFTKYNYWILVAFSLAAAEFAERISLLRGLDHRAIARRARIWAAAQWKLPTNYIVLAAVAVLAVRILDGWWHLWSEAETSGRPYENTIHLVYLAIVLRVVWHWKTEGAFALASLPPQLQQIGRWHLFPIAIWFALPKRLAYFLWYISPANGPNTLDPTLLKSVSYYWSNAAEFYYASAWLLIASIAAAAIAVCGDRWLRKQWRVVLLFVAVSLLLTLNHGNQKVRFLHTWLPAVWVLSGLGMAVLSDLIDRAFMRISPVRIGWAAGTSAAVVWVLLPLNGLDAGRSAESGHGSTYSSLTLPDHYLPWLADVRGPAVIVGTLPIEYFAEWTYIAAYPDRPRPLTTAGMRWFGNDPQVNRDRFAAWLEENHPESIVLVDVLEGSPIGFPDFENFRQFRELIADRGDYTRVCSASDELRACTLSHWVRAQDLIR